MKKSFFVIETEGEIEPELVELLGASTRRNDHRTIGMFGSGAKYSIIQALRMGIEIYVSTSKWFLTFETEPVEAGGETFKKVIYIFKQKDKRKKRKPSSYTLNMGKNWIETWYVLREWIANALDNRIETGVDFDMNIVDGFDYAPDGKTRVYIEYTPEIAAIIQEIDKYMKTPDMEPIFECSYGALYEPTGKEARIFHKGMLVKVDADHDALFDYSLNNIDLSEERTPKYSWQVESQCAELLAHAPESMRRRVMRRISMDKDRHHFESTINFEYSRKEPWVETFKQEFPNGVITPDNPRLQEEVRAANRTPVTFEGVESMKRCLETSGDVTTVEKLMGYDARRYSILDETPKWAADRIETAQLVLDKYFRGFKENVNVVVFELRDGESFLEGDLVGDDVGINIRVVERSLEAMVAVILEEYMHLRSKAGDGTRSFQNALLEFTVNLIMKEWKELTT